MVAEAELSRIAQAAILEPGEAAPAFAHRRAAESLRTMDIEAARHWCVVGRRAQHILGRMSRARH